MLAVARCTDLKRFPPALQTIKIPKISDILFAHNSLKRRKAEKPA